MMKLLYATAAAAALFAVSGAVTGCPGTCTYNVYVETVWNPVTFPTDYPANAHWSPFFTITHDMSYSLWKAGGFASLGLKDIAELGDGVNFFAEAEPCTTAGSCGAPIDIPCQPFGGECSGNGTVDATAAYPYFSTASMIAPSPDWFIGIDSWPLCQDGTWITGMEASVNVYDAGTDSGVSFLSADAPTMPPAPIVSLAEEPIEDSIFFNPTTNTIAPIGTIMLELESCTM